MARPDGRYIDALAVAVTALDLQSSTRGRKQPAAERSTEQRHASTNKRQRTKEQQSEKWSRQGTNQERETKTKNNQLLKGFKVCSGHTNPLCSEVS